MSTDLGATADDRPSPLYEMYLAGAAAMCDAWAVDPYPIAGQNRGGGTSQHLTLISFTAPQSTTKGMSAVLKTQAKERTADLVAYRREDPRTPTMSRVSLDLMENAQYWQTRVNSLRGYHHVIGMARNQEEGRAAEPEDGAPDETFYIYAKREEDGPRIFYREFAGRSPTPCLPEWADQIWGICAGRGEIRELKTFGIKAWRCDMRYDDVERVISQKVAARELPVPL